MILINNGHALSAGVPNSVATTCEMIAFSLVSGAVPPTLSQSGRIFPNSRFFTLPILIVFEHLNNTWVISSSKFRLEVPSNQFLDIFNRHKINYILIVFQTKQSLVSEN